MWWNFLEPVTKLITQPIVEWQKRKTIKAESKRKVAELLAEAEVTKAQAQIEMAKAGQAIEADWDARAQEGMRFSWKDEVLLLVFIHPFVLAPIPFFQPIIEREFQIIEGVPLWWRVVILGMVASSFGLRWLVAPLVSRWVRSIGGQSNGK